MVIAVYHMFEYKNNKDKTFLIGVYRSDKPHIDWILGTNPRRYQKLYDIRYNHDIYSQRNVGVLAELKPDYVLIYDFQSPKDSYHLFECVNSSIKTEEEMQNLSYPSPKGDYIVFTLDEELEAEPIDIPGLIKNMEEDNNHAAYSPRIIRGSKLSLFVDKNMTSPEILSSEKKNVLRFIDIFAGIGGIRCGLEQAARKKGLDPVCVMTSEIKSYAVEVLKSNHPGETIVGDITKVSSDSIPEFDILCAGFPCQAFSAAGKRQGFADTRGTLFFEVERILRDKRPKGFILENVEGLVNHDGGKTLKVIVDRLTELKYKFDFRVLNSKFFGVPQERKRIYIVGSIAKTPDLDGFDVIESKLSDVLESGLPTENTPFIRNLLNKYTIEQLYGKSIKDKRGGEGNIHSWDLEIKGPVSAEQKQLLNSILTERRKKKWAEIIGIDWMDGMPLTTEQIGSFFDSPDLQHLLDDLTEKKYLKFEHPKKLVKEKDANGNAISTRIYDETKPKGYNIVAGKLSYEINKIMSPEEIAPTLVAMDMQKLYVGDNGGLRKLSLREGLRLFGYPDNIKFDVSEKDGFDLLGNTVVVPVIEAVAERLLDTFENI